MVGLVLLNWGFFGIGGALVAWLGSGSFLAGIYIFAVVSEAMMTFLHWLDKNKEGIRKWGIALAVTVGIPCVLALIISITSPY